MRGAFMSWSRFISDIKYDLLVPPLGLDFVKMTPKQSKENFDWFMQKITERTMYLINRCSKDIKASPDELKFSPETLKIIWRWFLKTARMEKTPNDELEQMKKQFAHLGESFINKEKFTVVTEYIIRDIGMYLGQVFTVNYKNIYWDYYTKPKNDFFVNRPQLFGFVDNNYNPPFKPTFEPIHMTGVQAAKLFDNTHKETDLYDIFMKWKEWT